MSFQAYNSATDTLTPIAENDYKDSLEKVSALPTASADLLNMCYLLTANQGTYTKGNIYQCQSDGSGGYTWILVNGSGVPVDVVEDGNMNAVTSNAVADKFETLGTASQKNFTPYVSPDNADVPISSSVYSAITSAVYGAYHPSGSKTISELTSDLLVLANIGNVYKITEDGVTTELFIGGAGQTINAGDNAVVVYASENTFKFDLQSGVVDLSGYQEKDLTTAVEGETTVEGALGALSSGKASKVTNATNGDIATLDANGNLVDSGISKKVIGSKVNMTLLTNEDLNDISTEGWYYTRDVDSVTNKPYDGLNNNVIHVFYQGSTGRYSQVLYSMNANRYFVRKYDANGWGSWQKLITESDLKDKYQAIEWNSTSASITIPRSGAHDRYRPYKLTMSLVSTGYCELVEALIWAGLNDNGGFSIIRNSSHFGETLAVTTDTDNAVFTFTFTGMAQCVQISVSEIYNG